MSKFIVLILFMKIDTENQIVKLCIEGIQQEAADPTRAAAVFLRAWNLADTATEKYISAHYLARHQKTDQDKLTWDLEALKYAQQAGDVNAEGAYPSLFLNIAKGYEDLNDINNAVLNYNLALSFCDHLGDDGYGRMTRSGILACLERLKSVK